MYLPNAVHTPLLQGDWLAGHVKAGTVTVLAGADQLQAMDDAETKTKITILKSPKFWKLDPMNANGSNSWTNFFKGRVQWGYLYNKNCELCKLQNSCKGECKHINPCKLYTIVNERGEDVVTVKRANVNARLPVRGTSGAAGYDLSAAQSAVAPAQDRKSVV